MSEDLRISLGFEDRPVVDGLTRLRKEFGELGKTIDATGKVYGPGPGRGMPTPEFMAKLEQSYARQKAAIEAMGRAYQASQERIGAAQAKLASSGAGDAQRAAREELDREVIAREKVAKRIEAQIKAVNRLAEDTAKANRLAAQAGGLGINVPKMAAGLQGGGDVGSLNRALTAEIKAINDVNKSIDTKIKKMDEAVAAELREVAAINRSIDSQLKKMDALDAGRVRLFQSQKNIDAAAAAERARITAQMKADEDKRASDAAAAQLLRLKSLGATAITEQAIADQHSALRRAMLEDSKRYESAMEAANERALKSITKRSSSEQDFALQRKAILDSMVADQERYDTAIEAANERARRSIAKRSTSEQDFAIQHKAILDAMRSDQEKHESAMEALRSRGLKEINGRAKVEQKVSGDLAKIKAALLADEVKFDASQAAAEAARVAKHKQAREMELQIDQSFISAEQQMAAEHAAILASMNAADEQRAASQARLAMAANQRIASAASAAFMAAQQGPAPGPLEMRAVGGQYSYGQRMEAGFQETRQQPKSMRTQDLTGKVGSVQEMQKDLAAQTAALAAHNAKIAKLGKEREELEKGIASRSWRQRASWGERAKQQNDKEIADLERYNARVRALRTEGARLQGANSALTTGRGLPSNLLAPAARASTLNLGGMNALAPQLSMLAQRAAQVGGALRTATTAAVKFVGLPFRALGAASGAMNALSFSAWKLTSGLNTAKMAWTGFMNIVKRGEEMERVKFAFDSMTKGIGVSLEGLRKASGGMIDDRQLMKLSTFGAQAKMGARDLEMMMKRSQGAALVTGRDPEEILKRMVMGVGKREREIMDELTVMMPNAIKIWQGAAKKNHKSVDSLTEGEKQDAYMQAFEKASRHLDKAANALPASLTKVARFQAGVNNMMDEFTNKIMKMATETTIFADVSSMISGAFDGITTFINESGVSGLIGEWVPLLGDVLGGLGTAVGALAPILQMVTPLLSFLAEIAKGGTDVFILMGRVVAEVARVLVVSLQAAIIGTTEVLGALLGWVPVLGDALGGLNSASKKSYDQFINLDFSIKTTTTSLANLENQTVEVNSQFQTQITSMGQLNNAMKEFGKQSEISGNNIEAMGNKLAAGLNAIKEGRASLMTGAGSVAAFEGLAEARLMLEQDKKRVGEALGSKYGPDTLKRMMDGTYKDSERDTVSETRGGFGNLIRTEHKGSPEDIAIKGYVNRAGEKRDLTYADMKLIVEQMKESEKNLDKLYDELLMGGQNKVDEYGKGGAGAVDTTKHYKDVKIAVPTVKSEATKPKNIEDLNMTSDRLNTGSQVEYFAGIENDYTNYEQDYEKYGAERATKFARMLDALSIDRDATGSEWKYDEAAVRTNINAFESLQAMVEDDIYRDQTALIEIQNKSKEQIEFMAGFSMSQEDYERQKAMLISSLESGIAYKETEAMTAARTAWELRQRLPPPKTGGGGGRSKQESIKYIMPELIEIADQNLDRINQVLSTRLGHAAEGKFLWEAGEKYSSNMAYMISGAVERNIQDDIENHRDAIHDAAIKGMETVNATVANAAAATSPEQFADYMALHGQAQMAVQKSGFLEGTEEDAKRINAALAATSEWFSEQETLWGHFKDYTDQVKVAQDAALQSQFDLQTARYEAEIKLKEHMDATTVGFGNNSDTPFANGTRYTKEDMPEWRRAKMKDPREAIRAAIREREEARIIAEADLKKEEMRASWRASGSLQDTELETNLGKVDRDAKSKIGGLRLADSEQTMAFERAQIEEHAQGMQEAFDGLGNYVAGTAGNALTYSMVDAFSVWQNATLTMTEDWTENMMAMIESAVSDMGTALDAFTAKTVELYSGSAILGTGAGALVGGVFKGLMSLFKQKSDSDKQEKRAAEREMRRKETKKTTEFSVTVINQAIPVTHVVQNQLAKNMKSFLRSGGKLQGAL